MPLWGGKGNSTYLLACAATEGCSSRRILECLKVGFGGLEMTSLKGRGCSKWQGFYKLFPCLQVARAPSIQTGIYSLEEKARETMGFRAPIYAFVFSLSSWER